MSEQKGKYMQVEKFSDEEIHRLNIKLKEIGDNVVSVTPIYDIYWGRMRYVLVYYAR